MTRRQPPDLASLPPAPAVILCRPQIGENVGATARAMLNFGLVDLRLVAPECGWPNAKAVAMASGAVSVLNGVRLFPTLEAATADLHHLLATTARAREMRKAVLTPAEAVAQAALQLDQGRGVGLVFGAERTGLENAELDMADALVRIPTSPAFASLNLAQAVLVLAWEWGSARFGLPPAQSRAADEAPPATKGEVDGLLHHLTAELEAADFFKSADSQGAISGAIKRMIERRGWTRPEVNLMRGIVRELAARPGK